MNRRNFLKKAAASGAALAVTGIVSPASSKASAASRPGSTTAQLPRRPYGKSGVQLSILGFPGFSLNGITPEEADRVVAAAIERGINYFDIAPSYGNAQERLGPALHRHRKNVFLACKTTRRDRAGAAAELKASLEALRTDHFDLYQLHAITSVQKDVDPAFARGGAMEAFLEARKAGVIRHLGFSAHSEEAALAAMDRFDFDSALFPVNFASMTKGRFGMRIIEKAREKGATCLALKAMARQKWPGRDDPRRKKFRNCWYEPVTDRREARLSLRYTLSQPVAAAIPPADVSLLPLAIDLAAGFQPITPAEIETLKSLAADWQQIFPQA